MRVSKLLFFIALLSLSGRLLGQSAALTVNNCTDFSISVTVYGYAPSTCDAYSCFDSYVTNAISVPSIWGMPPLCRTWGPYTPCGVASGIGFATNACNTNFCSGKLPSDFNWTFAEVTVYSTFWGSIYPIRVGDLVINCRSIGTASITYSCCGGGAYDNLNVAWSSAGGTLANVAITVTQY
jgi:hypothetical protein